ncbi:hypothetical protein [Ralstonia mannitolilytica]|uniref:hypothetical protein n=1 Tax=Ralstonia mannitolilytica TaxID=105219 RepID=UPI0007AFE77F|nr:hypothetical protein [Ralstonia mannitolilytica]ANA34459.1 hypothetical protein VZ52_14260 [Ralstonia mannitolilytica]
MAANLTRLAGILPTQPLFRAWLEDLAHQPITVDDAAEFIRLACQVESRRQIDGNPQAAELFHTIVRRPFIEWRDRAVLAQER